MFHHGICTPKAVQERATRICYNEEMNVWHVTPTSNVFGILEEGLVPSIGERSQDLGEDVKRVYVFISAEAMENALSNWLGEAFDEDEALSILVLDVEPTQVVVPDNLFEAYVLETIAPSCIVRIVAEQNWVVGKEPCFTPPEENRCF